MFIVNVRLIHLLEKLFNCKHLHPASAFKIKNCSTFALAKLFIVCYFLSKLWNKISVRAFNPSHRFVHFPFSFLPCSWFFSGTNFKYSWPVIQKISIFSHHVVEVLDAQICCFCSSPYNNMFLSKYSGYDGDKKC